MSSCILAGLAKGLSSHCWLGLVQGLDKEPVLALQKGYVCARRPMTMWHRPRSWTAGMSSLKMLPAHQCLVKLWLPAVGYCCMAKLWAHGTHFLVWCKLFGFKMAPCLEAFLGHMFLWVLQKGLEALHKGLWKVWPNGRERSMMSLKSPRQRSISALLA